MSDDDNISLLDLIKSFASEATVRPPEDSTLSLLQAMPMPDGKATDIVTLDTIEKLKAAAHWGEKNLPLSVAFDHDVIGARARLEYLLSKVDVDDTTPPATDGGDAVLENRPDYKTAEELSFERLRAQEKQQEIWNEGKQDRDERNVTVQGELLTQEALRQLQNMKRDELAKLHAIVKSGEHISVYERTPEMGQARDRIEQLTRSGRTRSRGYER